MKKTLQPTKNDIPQAARRSAIDLLNAHLADGIDLALQIKQAHWNVKGPQFISLHLLFDEVAEEVNELIDEIAERVVQLGGIALGTIRAVVESSRLSAYPLDIFDGQLHIKALSSSLSQFGKTARAAIDEATRFNDADTADLFTQTSRTVDKLLWKVEAHSVSDESANSVRPAP